MKVSICIPTFNQCLYLEQAIRSAFNQTLTPYEIIVADDNSTDETQTIIKRLSAEIPIIKNIHQPQNLGIAKNTDICMRFATGDFIIRLDSDDYLSPFYTEKLLGMLLKFPNAGYAHASVQEIDQYGNFLRSRRLIRDTGYQQSPNALKSAIKGYRVAANIIMFRKSALIKVNYLTGRPSFGEDFHLTASISAAGFGNVYLDEVLSYYRVWLDIGMVRQKRKSNEIAGLRQVFEEVLEPAFKERGWNVGRITSSKTRFACGHADCLSWNIYDNNEKEQLKIELYKLSSAYKVKFFTWLYMNGYGSIITFFTSLKSFPKYFLKSLFLRVRN